MKHILKFLGKQKVILVICMFVVSLVFTGCVKSDEDVIKKSVKAELDMMKNLDEDALREMVSAINSAGDLTQYGIDAGELCRSMLDKFDYTIGEIKVSKENATVAVTITCKDLAAAFVSWTEEISSILQDPATYSMTEEEFVLLMGESLVECIQRADIKTEDLELPYEKENNTWKPSSGVGQMIANAMAEE